MCFNYKKHYKKVFFVFSGMFFRQIVVTSFFVRSSDDLSCLFKKKIQFENNLLMRRPILLYRIHKFRTSEVKLLSFLQVNPNNLFDFLFLHESFLKAILWILQFTTVPKYVRKPNVNKECFLQKFELKP